MLPLPHPSALLHPARRRGVHRHVPRLLHLQHAPHQPPVPQRGLDSPNTQGTVIDPTGVALDEAIVAAFSIIISSLIQFFVLDGSGWPAKG